MRLLKKQFPKSCIFIILKHLYHFKMSAQDTIIFTQVKKKNQVGM